MLVEKEKAVPARVESLRPPKEITDEELLNRMFRSASGQRIRAGCTAGTPAPTAMMTALPILRLCNYLAWWSNCDAMWMDRLFRASRLMRPKWDEKRGEQTYGQRTIAIAIAGCNGGYEPNGDRKMTSTYTAEDRSRDRDHADTAESEIATAADLIRMNAGLRWLWQGWIPVGVLTGLASEPGVGKTRFCADLARRIYLGLPWPDGTAMTSPKGSKVLWVAADNQHPELASLPVQFGFPAEAVMLNASKAEPFTGNMLDSKADLTAFERRIRVHQPALVFIDTALNATDRGCVKPEDAKAFFVPLQQIAQRMDVAIICLTHLNASGKPLGRRILGQMRVMIQMCQPDPVNQPHRRKLWVTKSNSLMPGVLGVTMGSGGNEYDDKPPVAPAAVEAEGEVGSRLDEVCDWLQDLLTLGARKVCEIRARSRSDRH